MERWGIKSPHDNNIEQADDSQELISTESFGTSMRRHVEEKAGELTRIPPPALTPYP
jgi:hypothetical protein